MRAPSPEGLPAGGDGRPALAGRSPRRRGGALERAFPRPPAGGPEVGAVPAAHGDGRLARAPRGGPGRSLARRARAPGGPSSGVLRPGDAGRGDGARLHDERGRLRGADASSGRSGFREAAPCRAPGRGGGGGVPRGVGVPSGGGPRGGEGGDPVRGGDLLRPGGGRGHGSEHAPGRVRVARRFRGGRPVSGRSCGGASAGPWGVGADRRGGERPVPRGGPRAGLRDGGDGGACGSRWGRRLRVGPLLAGRGALRGEFLSGGGGRRQLRRGSRRPGILDIRTERVRGAGRAGQLPLRGDGSGKRVDAGGHDSRRGGGGTTRTGRGGSTASTRDGIPRAPRGRRAGCVRGRPTGRSRSTGGSVS